jgi:Raf kinase inhibitor-like YbhB/YbcL family protein
MTRAVVLLTTIVLTVGAGCGDDKTVEGSAPEAPAHMRITSPAFSSGGVIPERFTCDGEDISPPLSWPHVPTGVRAFALMMEDADAPGGTFVHWNLFDIPAGVRGTRTGQAPKGSVEGDTSFGVTGYGGPCPPKGDEPHHYAFLVYALSSKIGLKEGASPEEVRDAVGARALARGELQGLFGR